MKSLPLAYMRGRTLNDSFVILDEAQNSTVPQMKMFLTRLGFRSKMVVTGDITQVDLPVGTDIRLDQRQTYPEKNRRYPNHQLQRKRRGPTRLGQKNRPCLRGRTHRFQWKFQFRFWLTPLSYQLDMEILISKITRPSHPVDDPVQLPISDQSSS